MSSEDVIELGSSDDEAPPQKKKKIFQNAMVHIPDKLPGITIRPTKRSKLPHIPIKNVKICPAKNKSNGSNSKQATDALQLKPGIGKRVNELGYCISQIQSFSVNKSNVVKSSNNIIKSPIINPLSKSMQGIVKPKMKLQESKILSRLPPGIIVKKPDLKENSKSKKLIKVVANKQKPAVVSQSMSPMDILTVEIDDEDTPEAIAPGPLWYLRPEEQNCKKTVSAETNTSKAETIEEQNNKEPESKQFIEITIEDSPAKIVPIKCLGDGNGAITIEDSPNKNLGDKGKQVTEKQSKKKLDYPIKKTTNTNEFVEIEIDLGEVPITLQSDNNYDSSIKQNKQDCVEDKLNIKSNETNSSKLPEEPSCSYSKTVIPITSDEFHPVYLKFIETCFRLENSIDMTKIVEKKIKAYYRQCQKDYVESEEFIEFVSGKILAIETSPDKMYLYIKDVVDELNMQRKIAKSVPQQKEEENLIEIDRSEYDSKRQQQIRKLEKTLKKLHRAIQKLEEQEIDFEDEDDSVYLLTARYKERLVRVHSKFCQLTNTKLPSEPKIVIESRPGRPSGPAKLLEKWINRKVPIGSPLPFPDFHDVLRFVREANNEDKLGWNEADIMEEARDLFTRCGKKLQRRRQENEWRIASSRLSLDKDPAEESETLKNKLDNNKKLASKEAEVLNKYVDKQNFLKLEAEEIGDKEAEESPLETEEEDDNDACNALEDKEKRKNRLKRLLKEKSGKNSGEIETSTNVEECNRENDNNMEVDRSEDIDNNENVKIIEECIETVNHNEDKNNADDKNDSKAVKVGEEHDVESDIDELHLLQKLHSESDANSSKVDSSDSESPIAISDTLPSESESENNKPDDDVISIENSSYSENENDNQGVTSHNSIKNQPHNDDNRASLKENIELECSVNESETAVMKSNSNNVSQCVIEDNNENLKTQEEEPVKSKNDQPEVDLSRECETNSQSSNDLDNLLASDEDSQGNDENSNGPTTSVNLGDDNISISETCVAGIGSIVATECEINKVYECNLNLAMGSESNAVNSAIDTIDLNKPVIADVETVNSNPVIEPKDNSGECSTKANIEISDEQNKTNKNISDNSDVGTKVTVEGPSNVLVTS